MLISKRPICGAPRATAAMVSGFWDCQADCVRLLTRSGFVRLTIWTPRLSRTMEANQESGLWVPSVIGLQRLGKCYQQPDRQTD
jgi:hypothetical protein